MYQITVDTDPNIEEMGKVREGIIQFNDSVLKHKSEKFAVYLRDESGKTLGGLTAWTEVESIYVDILWVDQSIRGLDYGSKLLQAAENYAREQGFRYSTLDTFSFQAEEFYLKNGYNRIGEIKNYIREHSRIYLRKTL